MNLSLTRIGAHAGTEEEDSKEWGQEIRVLSIPSIRDLDLQRTSRLICAVYKVFRVSTI
jgi:hypothetical protein